MNSFIRKIKVKNTEISNFKEWEHAFHDSMHWKEGRSAYSLADFVINRNGIERITEILGRCGYIGLQLLSCDIEIPVKFDDYKRPSQRDMILTGKLKNSRVFITVEAKVDENFSKIIGNSIISQSSHRAKELLKKFIPYYKEQDKKLRYQLFHATAATIEKGDYGQDFQISIMLILVFKTKGYGNNVDYNERKGQRNYKDFCDYMQAIGAKRIIDKETDVWSLNFKGKEVVFIYSQIEHKNLQIKE
ncbi:DUF6946 family protein [Bacteroides sp.]